MRLQVTRLPCLLNLGDEGAIQGQLIHDMLLSD